MALSDRHSSILLATLQEHIKTARPVSSEILVEKHGIDLSSASVRSVLLDLEEDSYLIQPYTSAGRVPTVKAYRYYIDNFLEEAKVPQSAQVALRTAIHRSEDPELQIKSVAKAIAELTSNTVLIGFAPHNVYYTGISYLFHQPEFTEMAMVLDFSELIDRLDDVIARMFGKLDAHPKIFLGKGNPFGEDTGAVVAQCSGTLVGIVGPMRMPYDQNIALLRYTQKLLA